MWVFPGLHCQHPKQPVHLPVPNATGKKLAFWVCCLDVREACCFSLCWTLAPVQADGLATLLEAALLCWNSLAFTGVYGRLIDALEEQAGWLEHRGSTGLECGVSRRKFSRHFDALHMSSRVTKAAHLWRASSLNSPVRVVGVSRLPFPPAAQSLCRLPAVNLQFWPLVSQWIGGQGKHET